ncbi:MAG: hypothetical protein ACLVES_06520 [Faecalibacterium prausnitzii]
MPSRLGRSSRPITGRAGHHLYGPWRCRGWTASARRKIQAVDGDAVLVFVTNVAQYAIKGL